MNDNVPQWFKDLANKIDWAQIDADTQRAFRSYMIDFASSTLPIVGDNAVKLGAKKSKMFLLKKAAAK